MEVARGKETQGRKIGREKKEGGREEERERGRKGGKERRARRDKGSKVFTFRFLNINTHMYGEYDTAYNNASDSLTGPPERMCTR